MARRNDYRRRRPRLLPILNGIGRQVLRLAQLGLFLLVLAGVSLGLVAAYNWVVSTDLLAVESIEVTGNRRLDRQDILRTSGVSTGENILAVSIASIEERLSRDPWVERVIVRRVLPDRLAITITEREAVYWVQRGEAVHYADAEGQSIAPVLAEHFVSLPLVDMRPESERQKAVLKEVTELFSQKRFPFSLAEVGWISFLCDEIVQIHLYDRNMTVRISAERLKRNTDSLVMVWRDLANRQELARVDRIMALDGNCWVRFASGPVKG